jgi:hypothetical protein
MSSIQFRSRIKPAFDYSSTLNSYGVCCGITGSEGVPKSFTECFNEGGHFIPVFDNNFQNVKCPDHDTRLGCCCSCSYVLPTDIDKVGSNYFTSGTRSNVSRCECDRLGGKWTETTDGSCPTLDSSNLITLCGQTDVRTPKSCCHLVFDDNTGWPTGIGCTNVCTSKDCAELGTEVYPSVFGTNICAATNCASSQYYSFMATKSSLYQDFDMGSCYTLEEVDGTYQYTCSLTPQSLCYNGYWVKAVDQENLFCNTTYQPSNPQLINSKYQPQSMSLTDFNNIGLTPGDEYQGGIYIGIFESPSSGVASEVYGNLNFSPPTLNSFSADNVGSTAQRWAIIVDQEIYNVPFLTSSEQDMNYNTSLWDGYYNTYGDNVNFQGIQSFLTQSIRYNNRNGFIDYYLPSIYELFFYSAYLYKNGVTSLGNIITSSIFNTKYLNSGINKYLIGNKSYVFGQSINTTNDINYKTILIEKKIIQSALFFRRIILT